MYIAAAANALSQASVAINDTIFYGSNNLLVKWDLHGAGSQILSKVSGRIEVLAVQDGQIWIGTDAGDLCVYKESKLVTVDTLPRSCSSLCVRNNLVAVACLDSNVYIYKGTDASSKEVLSLDGYALCVEICEDLIIMGGTGARIILHNMKTSERIKVEGHENWIRSLSLRKDSDGSYILASASQERYIRLWRLWKGGIRDDDPFSTKHILDEWSVMFEALLIGHDDWVVSVSWDPEGEALLSASSDSSLIIWKTEGSDIWTPSYRLGDISTWGASTATGTSGGFWTALWLHSALATVTKTGSWKLWLRERFQSVPGPTGHYKTVTDVCWFGDKFLLSTSLDQTTRLWYLDGENFWELGRPQIHGYDMVAVDVINQQTFISAGDEKVMRVFEMPREVASQIKALTEADFDTESLPEVATMPALGLSNKAGESEGDVDLPAHPREDHLHRLTLWPEIDKLYGHGYEISTLAVSRLGVVASCSKANTENHAVIRFYDTKTWHEIEPPVPGHSLTVTRLKVSPNGRFLLSVSRDRKWMVTDIETHKVVAEMPKAHSRIIWDGAWTDNDHFVTVSRDKTIKKWSIDGELLSTQSIAVPVTAVDSASDGRTIVIGLETGVVVLLDQELRLGQEFSVAGRVNRIAFDKTNRHVAVASDLVTILDTTKP